MNIELYNDWYVRTDGRLGPYTVTTSQQPTTEQIHNATKIYNYFNALGWSLSAICGMIGNMMHESTINPAFIQATHRNQLPNSAANLSDVPNSVMLSFYGSGANGSFIECLQAPQLISEFLPIVNENRSEYGRPLCDIRTINTLSGYIKCGENDLSFNATKTESEEINRYLSEGFFYE